MLTTLNNIAHSIPTKKIKTAVYLYNLDGKAITNDSFNSFLFTFAGLTNAINDVKNSVIELKALKVSNPDFIFCNTGLKAKIAQNEEYKNLAAVTNVKVFEISSNFVELQGESMKQTAIFMAGSAHPNLLGSQSVFSFSGSSINSTDSAATGALTKELKNGDKGEEVKILQQRLKELEYLQYKATDDFADGTVQAVKDFQYCNGLAVTGVADTKTINAIFASDIKKKPIN